VYHLQGVHPQLLKVLDDVNTTYELLGRHSAMYIAHGCRQSPLARTTASRWSSTNCARGRLGFPRQLLRQSEYFMEEGARPRSVTASGPQALLEVGRIEGEAQGRTTQG